MGAHEYKLQRAQSQYIQLITIFAVDSARPRFVTALRFPPLLRMGVGAGCENRAQNLAAQTSGWWSRLVRGWPLHSRFSPGLARVVPRDGGVPRGEGDNKTRSGALVLPARGVR